MRNVGRKKKNGRFVLAGGVTGLAVVAAFLFLVASFGGKAEGAAGISEGMMTGADVSSSASGQTAMENFGREAEGAYDSLGSSAALGNEIEGDLGAVIEKDPDSGVAASPGQGQSAANQETGPGQGQSAANQETGPGQGQLAANQEASPGQGHSGTGQQPPVPESGLLEVAQEMTVHFLDVGQGDATLILCGTEAMLIDAGDNSQGTNVQNYLQKQGVETLKYVVCTHPDEDHIGGMDVILYKFDCETVFMTEEEKDTATYRDVTDTMAQKGYKRTLPVLGQQYLLGDAVFTILGPASMDGDSNNNSIAILLAHGEDTFLFTGDAEEEEESGLLASGLSLDADVYKAGHHGSRTSSSKKLLEAVSPACAVISCGEGNSYGHPHAETLNNLRAMGASVYRTDEQGTIVAASSGKGITWNCSPSETWQAGEPTGSATGAGQNAPGSPASQGTSDGQGTTQGAPGGQGTAQGASNSQGAAQGTPDSQGTAQEPATATPAYICNTNTFKFHYPSCSSVKQMKESNKLPTNATREEIIQQGYEPCKRCNP